MDKISLFDYTRLKEEKDFLEKEVPTLYQVLDSTRGEGDLSDNAPYQIARDNYNRHMNRLKEVKDILANSEISNPIGSNILPGRLLHITYLGEAGANGNPVGTESQEFVLLFSEFGESIITGCLSKDSDLGSLIYNKREGRHYLSRGEISLIYDIRILGAEHHKDFLAKFPVNKREKISSLLKGDF